MSIEDRVRKSLRISSHLAPEPPPIRREPKPRHALAVAISVAAVVIAVTVPAGLVALIHRQGVVSVTGPTSSTGTESPIALVPWSNQLGQIPDMPSAIPGWRKCSLADLTLPSGSQGWQKASNQTVRGSVQILNSSKSTCQLDVPAEIRIHTGNTQGVSGTKVFGSAFHLLPPGGLVRLQIESTSDCVPATLDNSFSYTVADGVLQFHQTPMPPNCAMKIGFGVPGALPVPALPVSGLEVSIGDLPASAAPGELISFSVELTNPGAADVVFDSCPTYGELLGGVSAPAELFVLNCSAAPVIPAGGSVAFEMRYLVPVKSSVGQHDLVWELLVPSGTADTSVLASASLTVAEPTSTQSSPSTVATTVVPWLDQAGVAPAFVGGPPIYPACALADLSTPARLQKWGGIWQGKESGYFEIENSSSSTCDLARPSVIAADAASGPIPFFDKVDGPPYFALPPGARVQVQVLAGNTCRAPQETSRSFSLTFPTGVLVVKPAELYVQCGGTLVDFSAPRALTENPSPGSYLEARIDGAPETAVHGGRVTFQVTLTNPTAHNVAFSECPVYQEGLKGDLKSQAIYVLNCSNRPWIAAGESSTYAMELPLSVHTATGATYLQWHLLVPSYPMNGKQHTSVPITIE